MTDTPSADNPGGQPLGLPLNDQLGPGVRASISMRSLLAMTAGKATSCAGVNRKLGRCTTRPRLMPPWPQSAQSRRDFATS